jgi:hypothetical protein
MTKAGMGYTVSEGGSNAMDNAASSLSERIQTLTSEQLAEVEVFVESLQSSRHDPSSHHTSAALSEHAFEAVWNNPLDDAYDAL